MVGLPLRLLAFLIPLGLSPCHNRAVTGQTRKFGEWFHLAGTNRFAASETETLPALRAARSGSRVERVDDVGRDAATRRHIMPVTTGPIADRGALLTVDGAAATPCA